jgi:DNA-binding transcriptional LysR family regulator
MEQRSSSIDRIDLLIFAQMAELGDFSGAADRLGLSKSNASQRLAPREQRRPERQSLRTTRRQALTEFGRLLLEHARRVAALGAHRAVAPGGRLRVSVPGDSTSQSVTGGRGSWIRGRAPGHFAGIRVERPRGLLGVGPELAVSACSDPGAKRPAVLAEGSDLAP